LLAAAVFLPMIVGAGIAIKLLLDAERHAVLREDGQQLFNTVVPFGQAIAPPPPGALERVGGVFERRRPTVSNLIVGSATSRYVISAELPLTLDDGGRVLLDQWFDVQHLHRLLPRDVPASWQVSVFDRSGAAPARNEGSIAPVGARASLELLRALRRGAARTELAGIDGAPMAAALARCDARWRPVSTAT
jgi:hypothetical protein